MVIIGKINDFIDELNRMQYGEKNLIIHVFC